MTDFQMEMVKILVDKALLGAVGIMFGYYLSKRLEMLRTQKAYDLFVWQQRAEACRTASRVVTEHYISTRNLLAAIHALADAFDDQTKKDALVKAGQDRIEKHARLEGEAQSLMPFLPPLVLTAIIKYMNQVAPLSAAIRGDVTKGPINEEDLDWAHSAFAQAVAAVVDAGPHREPRIQTEKEIRREREKATSSTTQTDPKVAGRSKTPTTA
jgi:hypothetical protein